jgi:hypothetical protein
MHAFSSGTGRLASQLLTSPAMLFYLFLGMFGIRRSEWATASGGMFIVVWLTYGLYLFGPDQAFGGSSIKIRAAWAVFIFGCVLATSVRRLRSLNTLAGIYVACLLAPALILAIRENVRAVSPAIDQVRRVLLRVPPNATLLRIGYPDIATRARFGFERIALEPLYHADARFAAEANFVDLTDYQPLAGIFPIVVRPAYNRWRYVLWSFENPREGAVSNLQLVFKEFPTLVDYVVVIGDKGQGDHDAVLGELRAHMQLIATDDAAQFVWLFRRPGAR